VHQCGAHEKFQDYERLQYAKQAMPQALQDRYWPSKYFKADEVGEIYQRSVAAVARSGANTVLEFAAVGLPAVFVPIPWVTHDEQTKNAQVLVDAGLALVLPEKELNGSRLIAALQQLLSQVNLEQARKQAKQIVVLDAATVLARLVEETATSKASKQ
jgi:UDP-N-acetylglucosamine--N-acetylmuramyl-(pentapeptide) pyrophosphoryl-undecaprenol N-acetylglucosamine transferase